MISARIAHVVLASCVGFAPLAVAADAAPPVKTVRFNRDIRPILSDKCFACHGPDTNHIKGDLRLDLRDKAVGPNKHGRNAIVPGNPDASELIKRIHHSDPDELMPPADSHKTLDAAEKKLLRDWIAQGAEYEPHWAYTPLTRPEPPAVKDAAWVRNPIDRFVLARLEAEGVKPSPEADRVTLIRRLHFDLTGLPPKPDEVEAFVKDTSADAYEKVVDRLLASPHFGERLAIYWLDLVRFADTNGYHGDNPRQMWLYRDYVIDAFNTDKPYDRFIVEQIAGDMMPQVTRDTRVASAFNRLLQTTQEGGAQEREYLLKYAADRVRNTSAAMLGSTMGCAECHDHKYDPFTARDFYSFAAFFADIKEVGVGGPDHVRIPDAQQAARLAEIDAVIAERQKALVSQTPELDAALAAWIKDQSAAAITWTPLAPAEVKSAGGATLARLDDGSYLASGANPDKDTYTITVPATLPGLRGLRLEVLPDDSLPHKGPGRASNGNFVLSRISVRHGDRDVKIAAATSTHDQRDYGIATTLGGGAGWAILPNTGKPTEGWFELAEPLGDQPATLTVTLDMNFGGSHAIGRFRLSWTNDPRSIRVTGATPPNIAAILAAPAEQRTDGQKQALLDHFRAVSPALADARAEIAKLEAERKAMEAQFPQLIVTETLPKPRETRILPRGNWLDDTGEVVEPAIPEFLGKLDTGGKRATRYDLALWIASNENPLTARVFVNRLWMLYFGKGLAAPVDDVGSQGSAPTHPDLIDYLASEFAGDWSVKRAIRQIVTSNTYRQSSIGDRDLRALDPYNNLLARQGRWRIDAELVRDNALSLSGLLVDKVGGPSVFPYQPAGYWMHLRFPDREWKNDSGESQYRRGLYTWWQRTFIHPALLAFDAPTREECTARRVRSNTPLQALVLLNDPTQVESARKFAERMIREGGTSEADRVRWAFRWAVSRQPTDRELAICDELFRAARAEYAADPAAVDKLLKVGQAPADAAINGVDLAVYTTVARAILNLHETITRN